MLHFVKKSCEDSLSLKRDKISIRGRETENMFECHLVVNVAV